MPMDQQARIDENRRQTRALLAQRLQVSMRQQSRVSQKQIAKRRALRYLRNVLIGMPLIIGCLWLAIAVMGLEIKQAQPAVQVTDTPHRRTPEPAVQPVRAPVVASATAQAVDQPTGELEFQGLRLDRELSRPVITQPQLPNQPLPPTSPLENQK